MSNENLHIIMPVKDSIETAKEAISCVVKSGFLLTVYDDFSSQENATILQNLASELGFSLVHLSEITSHPSPNYLLVLQKAQQNAINDNAHLLIIESDVFIKNDTIPQLLGEVKENIGLVASVTTNEQGDINFPYEYAKKYKGATIDCSKRLSFCCTLLTNTFLKAYSFENLNPEKNWFDVFISHKAIELGFTNRLMLANSVIHKPHSSRPWKLLKYSNPLLYYWRKITQKRDRI